MFRNFIHRPVLAIVISVLIVFTGLLAINQLPTAQFPEIAPTTVNIFNSELTRNRIDAYVQLPGGRLTRFRNWDSGSFESQAFSCPEIAAAFGLGAAMESSGLAEQLASGLTDAPPLIRTILSSGCSPA